VRPTRGDVPRPVGEYGVQPIKHPAWPLVVCCVVFCALFGVAFSFDDDGDPGLSLCPVDDSRCSPDETFCALPVMDGQRLVAGPAGRTRIASPGLLAAVPGGLCLLI
jgi:hypothetical protein